MELRAIGHARSQTPQSQVQWGLLALVIERPSYGYELATRFERAYGDALRLSSTSYAYTALQALEEHGLVEEVAGSGGGRQPKPIYRATDAGIEASKEQLISEVSGDRRRSRVSARKLAAFAHEPEAALALIAGIREACLLEAVQSLDARSQTSAELDPAGHLAVRLAAEEGRLAVDAKLRWLDYAARELQAHVERRPAR
jgi:DNA-binding PadR family transcriptional regulator